MRLPGFVCLSVCLPVCLCLLARLLKTRAWIWMKCCLSTDVGTWTNWLTFEPDPVYSTDAGTGLLSPISYALQPGILLRRKNPMYRYWAPVAAATRGFKMVLFTESRGNNFVRRTCAPPSALLVVVDFLPGFMRTLLRQVRLMSWAVCLSFVCLYRCCTICRDLNFSAIFFHHLIA